MQVASSPGIGDRTAAVACLVPWADVQSTAHRYHLPSGRVTRPLRATRRRGRPVRRASARGCAGDRFPMREVCGLAFAMTLIPPRDAGGQFRRADRDAWRAEGAPSFGLSRLVRAATAARMPSLKPEHPRGGRRGGDTFRTAGWGAAGPEVSRWKYVCPAERIPRAHGAGSRGTRTVAPCRHHSGGIALPQALDGVGRRQVRDIKGHLGRHPPRPRLHSRFSARHGGGGADTRPRFQRAFPRSCAQRTRYPADTEPPALARKRHQADDPLAPRVQPSPQCMA